MAVQQRNTTTKVVGTANNATPAEPTGAAQGDLMLAVAAIDQSATMTPPAGWTSVFTGISQAPQFRYYVYYIVRGPTAPDMTWVHFNTYREVFVIGHYSDVAATLVKDAQSASGSNGVGTGVNPNPPAVTAVAAAGKVICGGVNWAGAGASNWAPPSGYTIQNASVGDDVCLASKTFAAAGSEDPGAFGNVATSGAADYWHGFSVTVAETVTDATKLEGFRFYADDAAISASTALAAQDTNITLAAGVNVQFIALIDVTAGNPGALFYQLEYKLSTDSVWRKVPVAQPMPPLVLLDSGNSTSNVQTFDTASVTLRFGRAYLIAICHSDTAPEGDATGIATVGGAQTFTKIDSQVYDTIASNVHRLSIWRCAPTADVTAAVRIDLGDAGTGCAWYLIELDDVITTGTNGADGFGTAVKNNANAATSIAVTPGALVNTRSLQIAFGANDLNVTTDAPSGTGWNSLHAGQSYATPSTSIEAAYNQTGAAQQVTFSGAGSADRAAIVIEVKGKSHPVLMSASSFIAPGGEAILSGRLTPPSGGHTFGGGFAADDENPSDSFDPAGTEYMEFGFCFQFQSGIAAVAEQYQFRITNGGTPLNAYDFTPTVTIGAGGGGGVTLRDRATVRGMARGVLRGVVR